MKANRIGTSISPGLTLAMKFPPIPAAADSLEPDHMTSMHPVSGSTCVVTVSMVLG